MTTSRRCYIVYIQYKSSKTFKNKFLTPRSTYLIYTNRLINFCRDQENILDKVCRHPITAFREKYAKVKRVRMTHAEKMEENQLQNKLTFVLTKTILKQSRRFFSNLNWEINVNVENILSPAVSTPSHSLSNNLRLVS